MKGQEAVRILLKRLGSQVEEKSIEVRGMSLKGQETTFNFRVTSPPELAGDYDVISVLGGEVQIKKVA